MRARPTLGLLMASIIGTSGCPIVGAGDGWVVGSLYAEDCRDGDPLDNPGDFDLNADFFVGDPLLDSSDREVVNRSSLVVRIQQTSNRMEQSDSLLLQVHDTGAAARAFARGDPVAADDCFDIGGCPSGEVITRAQLNLYNRCPGNKSAFIASNREIGIDPSADEQGCFRPLAGPAPPLCPTLDDADRQRLLQLCDGDFNDRTALADIKRILGPDNVYGPARTAGNACLFFCTLGDARRDQPEKELRNFEVDYGEEVAGLFAYNLVDSRALTIGTCAGIRGQVYGMFSFAIVRSRAAQAFP